MAGNFGRGQSVAHLSVENMEVLRLFIVTAATIIAILTTIIFSPEWHH